MAKFSNSEYLDMILIYGETRCNARAARRVYQERFHDRQVPCVETFISVCQRVRDTGSVKPTFRNRGRQRPDEIVQAEEDILNLVEENPQRSSRDIGREVGVSHTTVLRTLKEQLLHPYHIQRVQCLSPNDFQPRMIFSQWLLQQHTDNPDFLGNVLVTDEACFTRSGITNFHNTHTWALENPHSVQPRSFQQRFSINVWAGIIGDFLIGPFVLPPRLSGRRYLHFLKNRLPNLLEHVPLEVRRTMWFLHDGAPLHITHAVRRHLTRKFQNRWIGRFGPIPWPPRSPDLNPLDYFLWGDMKSKVYRGEIHTVEELHQRIFQAAEDIRNNEGVFARVRQNWPKRCEGCLLANGSHFEQFV